jgi:hypothetical protein
MVFEKGLNRRKHLFLMFCIHLKQFTLLLVIVTDNLLVFLIALEAFQNLFPANFWFEQFGIRRKYLLKSTIRDLEAQVSLHINFPTKASIPVLSIRNEPRKT